MVTVHLKQKLAGRTGYSHHVPVTLTLRDNNWNTFEQTIYSDGATNTVTVTAPFQPSVAYLNRDELISHAMTASYKTIYNPGTIPLGHGNLTLQVQAVADSAFFFVEHNWAAPDAIVNNVNGYLISPQRFWRVDGIWPAGFSTNASLRYSGQLTGSSSHLDHLLITDVEDSLILLYRPDRAADWTEFATYTKSMGSVTDKTGTVNITNLQKGEYALAMKGQPLGLSSKTISEVKIHPNPADEFVTITSQQVMETLTVTNMGGQIVFQRTDCGKSATIDTTGFTSGTYVISGYSNGKRAFSEKVVVK